MQLRLQIFYSVVSWLRARTVTETATGTEDLAAPLATLYPNPTDGRFTLVFAEEGNYRISIASASGAIRSVEKVTGATCQMDISSYPDGVYLLG